MRLRACSGSMREWPSSFGNAEVKVPIEVTETKTKSEVTIADVEKYHLRAPLGRYDDWGHLSKGCRRARG